MGTGHKLRLTFILLMVLSSLFIASCCFGFLYLTYLVPDPSTSLHFIQIENDLQQEVLVEEVCVNPNPENKCSYQLIPNGDLHVGQSTKLVIGNSNIASHPAPYKVYSTSGTLLGCIDYDYNSDQVKSKENISQLMHNC